MRSQLEAGSNRSLNFGPFSMFLCNGYLSNFCLKFDSYCGAQDGSQRPIN